MAEQVELIDASKSAEWLRDEILRVFRQENVKPWKILNENEQEWFAARIEQIAKGAVNKVCAAIAATGPLSIPVKLGPLSTDKDGNAKVPATFAGELEDDEKLAIWNHINGNAVIVLMDPTAYTKIEKKAEIMPDQHQIPLAAGAQQPGQPDWPAVHDAVTGEERAAGGAPDGMEEPGAGEIDAFEEDPPRDTGDSIIEEGDELSGEELEKVKQTLAERDPTKKKETKKK